MLCGKCAAHLLDVVTVCPACGSDQILPDDSLKSCPECGDKLTDVASSCPGCSVAPALESLRVCPGCSAVIATTLKFCWSCGQKQVDSSPASPKPPLPRVPTVPSPPSSGPGSPVPCPACGEVLSGGSKSCPACEYHLDSGQAVPCRGCGVLVAESLTFCWSCGVRQGGVQEGTGKPAPDVPGAQPRPTLASQESGVPKPSPMAPPVAKPTAPKVPGPPATGAPPGAGLGKPPLPSVRPPSPAMGAVQVPQMPPVSAQLATGTGHALVASPAPASKKPLWIFATVAALVIFLGAGWAGYNWIFRGAEPQPDSQALNSGVTDPLSAGDPGEVPLIPETSESRNEAVTDLPEPSPPGKSGSSFQGSPPGQNQTPPKPRQPEAPDRRISEPSQNPVMNTGRGPDSAATADPPEVEVRVPSSNRENGSKSAEGNEDSSPAGGVQDNQSPSVAAPTQPDEPIRSPVESPPPRGDSNSGDAVPQVPAPSNVPASPPPYTGPPTGTIVWRGTVEKGAEVVIENGRANLGEITGGLPGVACMISLSDPSVAVSQAPGPGNKYSRLVLRFAKKSKQAVAINWEVIE